MFTRNWYKGISAMMRSDSSNDTYLPISGTPRQIVPYISFLGYFTSASVYHQAPNIYNIRTSLTSATGVILGTGNEPPTLDDYKLSGEIVMGFEHSRSIKTIVNDSGTTFEVLYTITNTSDNPITIGEIAIMAGLGGSNTGLDYNAIVERTALETPVTIEPGGVGQVTYTIRMNYPTA